MVLPIYVYGHPLLRRVSQKIDRSYEGFDEFMVDMWDTMYKTDGIGLAAPQIGRSVRVFVIDADAMSKEYPEGKDFKRAFINAEMVEESGEPWLYNEGCLSVPNIHEDVKRHSKIKINYYDQDWNYHEDEFDGIIARIIQHEYDHLEGKFLTDRLSPLRRRMLGSKLSAISKGSISVKYRIVTP